MITDAELMKKIEEVSTTFTGQLDDLNEVVGMVITGRLYGWRVVRLISSKRLWALACKLFGDLKSSELMPERGVLAHRSVGLKIVDTAGDYWDFVAGNVSRDSLPLHKRKMVN